MWVSEHGTHGPTCEHLGLGMVIVRNYLQGSLRLPNYVSLRWV